MNERHKIGKFKNRLKRLTKRVKDAPGDRQGLMTARMKEIESFLKKNE